MSGRRIIAVVAVAAAIAIGGWFAGRRGRTVALNPGAARLAVTWRGKYQGSMSLPAHINWCPGARRGILEAIAGDSGVAVVFYERDSLTSGPHQVVAPDAAAAAPAPAATVVMRWMRADLDTAVTGFRSQGGTVRITIQAGVGSGDINARMRATSGSDTLVLQGAFRSVPVATTAAACN